ncbi:hypothetical protein EAI_14029 [Harpegnathos saltator]|uniref:Uncharacterized protein n=1 Tax=Harpegnathos saltator TaxID=610380 RepID=E2BBH8_HARSA|nr:hypothetical protein EAI_14029 [Harpegnathos saltator]
MLKELLWRYFTHKNTHRYIDVLQGIVHAYNHTRHSTIMEPASVTLENARIASRTDKDIACNINKNGIDITHDDVVHVAGNIIEYVDNGVDETTQVKLVKPRTSESRRLHYPKYNRVESGYGQPKEHRRDKSEDQRVHEATAKADMVNNQELRGSHVYHLVEVRSEGKLSEMGFKAEKSLYEIGHLWDSGMSKIDNEKTNCCGSTRGDDSSSAPTIGSWFQLQDPGGMLKRSFCPGCWSVEKCFVLLAFLKTSTRLGEWGLGNCFGNLIFIPKYSHRTVLRMFFRDEGQEGQKGVAVSLK